MEKYEVIPKAQLTDDGKLVIYVQDARLSVDFPSDRLVLGFFDPEKEVKTVKWKEGDIIRRGVVSNGF